MTTFDYAQILEVSLNEIYIFDAETLQFVEANRGARLNIGYSLAELQQMTPLDIKPLFTLNTFKRLIEPLCKQEREKIVFTTQHRRKDRTLYTAEIHLQLMQHLEHDVFVAIILDITERERLSERTVQLAEILDKSLNEIYMFSANTLRFVEVNHGARINIGYDMAELRDMTPLDIKPYHTLETFEALIEPLRSGTEDKVVFITEHLRKDGTRYPVEVHLQMAVIEGDTLFVAIILDITERVMAQTIIDEAHEQQASLIRHFIKDTSHEFKTSLAIIKTQAYLLRRKLENANIQQNLETIEKQVQRVNQLVQSMQTVSVLETTDQLEFTSIDICRLLYSVLDEFEEQISRRRLLVDVEFIGDDCLVEANARLLRLAISHIVRNACDFNHDEGTISLYVDTSQDLCLIRIADTGMGIDVEHQSQIFDYLYRADSARAISGGAGLGLSIANRIV